MSNGFVVMLWSRFTKQRPTFTRLVVWFERLCASSMSCASPQIQEMTPKKIRALRTREKASQTVFAAYLNVTPSLVSKSERGEKHPQGASLKLLSLVEKKGLEVIA